MSASIQYGKVYFLYYYYYYLLVTAVSIQYGKVYFQVNSGSLLVDCK